MKLTDLNPRWIGVHGWSSDSVFHIGVTFDSPLRSGQRLAALFTPPIDPAGLTAKHEWGVPFPEQKHWQRSGDTFATLTLSPSLDFSASGEWHGHIINGEIT
jgi:hypothetical protein